MALLLPMQLPTYQDALPSFDCVGEKKVNSTKDTRPQPKTSSNLVSTSAPVAQYPPQQQCLGYPPPNQYGYSYLPPNQYGYSYPPPNQYGYSYPPLNQYGYQQPRYPPNQYNYPLLPNHYSYPHPPQHSVSNYQWQGVPQPSPHQGSSFTGVQYPIQHHHASHQTASSRTYPTVNRVSTICVDHPPHIRAKIQKQLLEAERKEAEKQAFQHPQKAAEHARIKAKIQKQLLEAERKEAESKEAAKIRKQLLEAYKKETKRKEEERKRMKEKLQKEKEEKKPANKPRKKRSDAGTKKSLSQSQLQEEEKIKQTVSWLLQCMQFTSDVNSITRTGIWEDEEKRRLLLGIFLFGFSNWKSIQQVVSTRANNQVRDKAQQWIPQNMSNIEATGILSTYEEVQAFYNQTLPKVESMMNQLDSDKSVYQLDPVTKEQWRERRAQGINKARSLLSNESESTTLSLKLGSAHSQITNLDLSKFTTQTDISHVKQAFQHYTAESLDLESGLTVSTPAITQKIDENDKQRCVVTCKVVGTSTQPVVEEVVDESTQNGEINVSAFKIGTTNKRFHDSLYIHIKEYSSAMLSLVDNLGEVASLKGAEVVEGMKYSENTAWDVVYSKMKKGSENEPNYPSQKHIKKDGSTSHAGSRDKTYQAEGETGQMLIRIDIQRLSVEADAGLSELNDKFMAAVNSDPTVPSWIKRALCIMLHERGGDRFGGKKKMIVLLLEIALQRKEKLDVPGEVFQWDDTVFIGLIAKLKEALEAIKNIFSRLGVGILMRLLSSWPPGTDEERPHQVYNTLVAEGYIGLSDGREDAFDGPAMPNWKTIAEKYSKDYTVKQFKKAIDKIKKFIEEAWDLRLLGCLFLLDKNDLACDGNSEDLEAILELFDFEVEATLYESLNDIIIYTNGKAIIVVHGPLSVGGTIMFKHFSLDDMLLRCLVIDTLRGVVCMAKGEEFNGPYLSIEAGMMQKLLVDGFHLTREYGVPAAFFREYLSPEELECFDLYANEKYVHYPEYSISNRNRERYRSHITYRHVGH